MQTVEIWSGNIHTREGHSSKGNQLKWQEDGWWYKADAFGYESLAETVSSQILQFSNIETAVLYEPVMIQYHGKTFRGCCSKNFRGGQEELVTLERLYRAYTGFSLARELAHFADTGRKIQHIDEFVGNVTGLEEFGKYLTVMLEIDAFFLNEDRHTNNIALIYDTIQKEYRLCPYFDMGLSLFSDTREAYPLRMGFSACRAEIQAKPFSRDFDEQMDAANERYGCHLKFEFKPHEILSILERLKEKYGIQSNGSAEVSGYQYEEIERVEETLCSQARKYQYMFLR